MAALVPATAPGARVPSDPIIHVCAAHVQKLAILDFAEGTLVRLPARRSPGEHWENVVQAMEIRCRKVVNHFVPMWMRWPESCSTRRAFALNLQSLAAHRSAAWTPCA